MIGLQSQLRRCLQEDLKDLHSTGLFSKKQNENEESTSPSFELPSLSQLLPFTSLYVHSRAIVSRAVEKDSISGLVGLLSDIVEIEVLRNEFPHLFLSVHIERSKYSKLHPINGNSSFQLLTRTTRRASPFELGTDDNCPYLKEEEFRFSDLVVSDRFIDPDDVNPVPIISSRTQKSNGNSKRSNYYREDNVIHLSEKVGSQLDDQLFDFCVIVPPNKIPQLLSNSSRRVPLNQKYIILESTVLY